ncbi:unnamed protein product, partial [Rotaria sp. Silwood1]
MKQKNKLRAITESYPDVRHVLQKTFRQDVGRPPVDDASPDLLATIEEIAAIGGAGDDRRRTESIRTCLTLDDLREALKTQGYDIKRTTLYYRLLPRRALSVDDDKCKVPIGLPAAKKQAPLLMHLDYVVKLPDHDFVVAPRHQMIPSVYAACFINKAGEVGYSGPTYIAIRSAKHDKSISANHRDDFTHLVKLQEFKNAALDVSNKVKSIVIITLDGGPDENPRFPKTLASSIDIFKTHDLDALFVLAHAPGQSAFNAVERRMAPLSHDLSGLILPHDHFGTHLDANGNTIDFELEKQNFKKAGEVLAEVWSDTVIDCHPVVASYVNSSITSQISSKIDEFWCDRHVLQSQYTLQIVRCDSSDCCGEWRSNFFQVFPQRFLPPPIPFLQASSGLVIAINDSEQDRFYGSLFQRLQLNNLVHNEMESSSIPFDYFCASVKQSILRRTCNICMKYFPSMERRKNHRKIHKLEQVLIDTENLPDDEDQDEHHQQKSQSTNKSPDEKLRNIHIIYDLAQWLKPTFEELYP